MTSDEKRFPIMHGEVISITSMPWEVITPHEAQANINHGQTLKRLAERGGLSPCEALAILENRRWRKMTDEEVRKGWLIRVLGESSS